MATTIRVKHFSRDALTWESPWLPLSDFDVTEDDTDAKVRSQVWRQFNAVDGDPDYELCLKFRVRSMMVGDMVQINRGCCVKTFRVVGIGWSEVAE